MAARQSTMGGQQYNADVRKRPRRRGKRTKAGICTVSLMERAPGHGPGFVGVRVFYGVPLQTQAFIRRNRADVCALRQDKSPEELDLKLSV